MQGDRDCLAESIIFVRMNRKRISKLVVIAALFLTSCGPTRFVEPLHRNENAVAVDLGGPLVKVPGIATLPLPFSSITYGRGITDKLTLHGTWYTTAAFYGDAQFEAGATYGFWKNKRGNQGVSGMLGFNMITDVFEHNFKFWPRLDAHYYWKYNDRPTQQSDMFGKGKPVPNLLYFGVSTWYELNKTKAHGLPRKRYVVPMFDIGHDLNWRRWTFKVEVRIIAPFASNRGLVVDYASLTGKTGATGIYLGFIKRF